MLAIVTAVDGERVRVKARRSSREQTLYAPDVRRFGEIGVGYAIYVVRQANNPYLRIEGYDE